jgi:hypothetical protein
MGAQKDVAYVYYYLSGSIERSGDREITNYQTRASNIFDKINRRWV